MKQTILQIATLLLCAVLLVVTIGQGRKLEEYRRQTGYELTNQYNSLQNEMHNIASSVEQKIAEGAKLVADYGLEPTGLDQATRSLLADVSVTLKEWRADTEVTLLATVGEKEVSLPMTGDGNGKFTGALAFPVEQQEMIALTATVTSDGMTRREELGGWSEVSMLLPVQMRSWGGSSPVYEDGLLTIGQHDGDLEGRDGVPVKVSDVCYRLYVNGEKVKEEDRCENWLQECAGDDEVRLTLFCRDEYGLGYEFTMMEFLCDENADGGTGSIAGYGTVSPLLTWD